MTSSHSSVFFIFLLLTLLLTVSSDLTEDKTALLKFMDKVGNESKIIWDRETDPCEWAGVTCNSTKSSVIFLGLPAAGLVGEIPPDSLGKITSLRNLSLHHNKLSGEFPDDFASLTELRSVNLHNNKFSGPFPSSVAKWTKLHRLNLSGNNFHGMLPDNVPPRIMEFNVSNNNFIGLIPKNLTRFPVSAFSGNVYLCNVTNFPPCNDTVISQQSQSPLDSPSLNHEKEEKLCTPAIAVIAVGSALILLLLLSYLRKERSESTKKKDAKGVATMAAKAAADAAKAAADAAKAAARGFEKQD